MSMDPCEEFRVHAAKNLVGLRFLCKNSSSFDEPRSLNVIEPSRQKTLDRTTLKKCTKISSSANLNKVIINDGVKR